MLVGLELSGVSSVTTTLLLAPSVPVLPASTAVIYLTEPIAPISTIESFVISGLGEGSMNTMRVSSPMFFNGETIKASSNFVP